MKNNELTILDYSEERWDELYGEYISQWKISQRYVHRMSGRVLEGIEEQGPLSKAKFKVDFTSERGDLPNLYGKKLAQRMAKHEVYPASQGQAEKLAKAYVSIYGGEVTPALIHKLRIEHKSLREESGFYDKLRLERDAVKAELEKEYGGRVTTTMIKMKMGQRHFGSK